MKLDGTEIRNSSVYQAKVPAAGEQVQDVQTTLPIGTLVQNRYLIEDLLGRGGFGAVYRVRDQRVKGNIFALKEVIDPSEEERERFAFECSVLKRMDHPGIPRVYREFEDQQSNRAYMLMDYVDGPNLEQLRLKQQGKRFPLARIFAILAPIIDAVEYLHAQDPPIIHRDIKPANIIVPTEGEQTVLVDLGIAKEYDQEGTTTAVRRCSPGYGAPEQYARGTNPRTDIYGLGATLYVLLTGVVPMDALYRMTQMGSKNNDPLEHIHELAPEVPEHIALAVERAMTISSNERYATVAEFWQAVTSESPASLPPPTPLPLSTNQTQNGTSSEAETPGVTTVVYPLKPGRSGRRRIAFFLLFAALAVLALVTGLAFGANILGATGVKGPSLSPTGQATRSSATQQKATAKATGAQATAKATATKAQATAKAGSSTTPAATQPAPTPTTGSLPPPVITSYPHLEARYDGQISDAYTSPPTNSWMALTNVQQRENDPVITGFFQVGPGLQGNGNFSGTVTKEKHVQFLVPSYAGLLPLFFTGTIQNDGSMKGTYCSVDKTYQCDNNGGFGTWQVAPPTHQSSIPAYKHPWS